MSGRHLHAHVIWPEYEANCTTLFTYRAAPGPEPLYARTAFQTEVAEMNPDIFPAEKTAFFEVINRMTSEAKLAVPLPQCHDFAVTARKRFDVPILFRCARLDDFVIMPQHYRGTVSHLQRDQTAKQH